MGDGGNDPAARFKLERAFDDLSSIFGSSNVPDASSPSVLLAFDTNVLLLPYTIRKDNLPKLQSFYEKILKEGRLYLPARAAREFIQNRDKKLAELLKTLGDVKSRINIGEPRLSPILEGVAGSHDLFEASEALGIAKKKYVAAVSLLEATVRTWSGDDPVTRIYSQVFSIKNIVSPVETEAELSAEWDIRRSNAVPPGYKDSGKDDTGIGDFLIWKSILQLAAEFKQDLIFVTGDEKADWFVRSMGAGAYPRPELVAEYRKFSGGKNLRLASFHDVLSEMAESEEFVNEVEKAEDDANSALRMRLETLYSKGEIPPKNVALIKGEFRGLYEKLEFSVPYGGAEIFFKDQRYEFSFMVSEAGVDSIWVYPDPKYKFYYSGNRGSGKPRDIESMREEVDPFKLSTQNILFLRAETGGVLGLRLQFANQPEPGDYFKMAFTAAIFQ